MVTLSDLYQPNVWMCIAVQSMDSPVHGGSPHAAPKNAAMQWATRSIGTRRVPEQYELVVASMSFHECEAPRAGLGAPAWNWTRDLLVG